MQLRQNQDAFDWLFGKAFTVVFVAGAVVAFAFVLIEVFAAATLTQWLWRVTR